MIRFACPHCYGTFDVADRRAGEKLLCDLCGRRVQVPVPPTPPPAPVVAPVVARSPDRATEPDRRSPRASGDLRSAKVARSGDRATTGGDRATTGRPRASASPLYYLLAALAVCTPFALAGGVLIAVTFAHRTPSSPAPPPPPETTSLTPDTTPPPNANDDLARQARQILTTNCYRCHGQAGAAEGGFNYILDPDKLAAHKIVKPGDAEHSYLIRRVEGGEMPPEGEAPRPAPADIAVLRRWIDAGAPAVS